MTSKQYWFWSHRVGLFLILATIACYLWTYLAITDAELLKLYHQIMTLSVLWWTGFDTISILLSLIQVYIWGYVGVGLWALAVKWAPDKR